MSLIIQNDPQALIIKLCTQVLFAFINMLNMFKSGLTKQGLKLVAHIYCIYRPHNLTR